MTVLKTLALLGLAASVSACGAGLGPDKSVDRGINAHSLTTLKAGIWIDPEGCDHWIIDDGVEGYLSARSDDYGKPICSGAGPANTAVGPFKSGSFIGDPL